ncbi:transposase PF05598 domain protein [Leptospira borgpetersenii serovar Pomona str. 200901868]|uniref:Transposase PF05598 domain protein n=1 Tax=Leptospira borgpetersenii serovar Pomona str. 200901868 TaxID=1192866 RepID=M6WKT0_LEPBO|nr:transposase PF05598 domain protein [Leptospira borgpetersenii serovar Pomona str. 200901868]
MYQISKKIDWEKFEKEFGKYYTEKTGRPGLRIRLLVGLHYLKHAYNVSDEKVVEGYLENPYWQYIYVEMNISNMTFLVIQRV